MSFNFIVDRITAGRPYPNCAQHQAEPYTEAWRDFGSHWPYTVPLDLYDYCVTHGYAVQLYTVQDVWPDSAYYPIAVRWFDHGIDWFELLPPRVCSAVRSGQIRVLFYYNEGDNPLRIKQRLDSLAREHGLGADCYRFVSGNTAADRIPGCAWFPDHELLYWSRNQAQAPLAVPTGARPYEFTLLSRTHKPWRATVVADLHRQGMLDHSLWSYNTVTAPDSSYSIDPMDLTCSAGLREYTQEFLRSAPYACDGLTADEHNDHSRVDPELFQLSYCHIILETFIDIDNSNGAFLTEKTFKVLKHGQPFVIVGCRGSMTTLRDMGYRIFGNYMDFSFDNSFVARTVTERWQRVLLSLRKLRGQNLQEWFELCRADIEHNQQLFCASKYPRLNTLYRKLQQ